MGWVSQTLRNSAKGQECTLRLLGKCNHDPTTTVLAHLPSPVKGMGNKGDDFHAVFACSACHAALDEHDVDTRYIDHDMLVALQLTQKFWFDNGYLSLKPDTVLHIKRTSKSLPPKPLYYDNDEEIS